MTYHRMPEAPNRLPKTQHTPDPNQRKNPRCQSNTESCERLVHGVCIRSRGESGHDGRVVCFSAMLADADGGLKELKNIIAARPDL